MNASYTIDGVTLDLTRTYVDVTGVEWSWTGRWTKAGEPLMQTTSGYMSLLDVYQLHGPLIPLPQRITSVQVRAAFIGRIPLGVAA
ncbi:phiSA1p31-related protein [Streptomyces sp. NRRL F-5135]|uniref:phiSA1p31-related protein n=1 Tax=Streptomyces sp. NRRL F-5135 TaxID=1463858 RepID=UPI0004CC8B39|nr:phiSA1p31-related protein [Streptomyces sp. NRRL F-5135]